MWYCSISLNSAPPVMCDTLQHFVASAFEGVTHDSAENFGKSYI